MSETLKKYGVWIAAGALVLYLVYKNMKPGGARILPSASGAESGLESERLRQSGNLALEQARLNSNLELARLKAANDRYNLEQQALARQRALDAAQRGQTLGLIGSIVSSIGKLLGGQSGQQSKSGSSGGSGSGGGFPGTPPIAGRTQPQLPPYYVPVPNIDINPPFYPEYPTITDYPLSVTDWGEAPQFESSGMQIDTGATFFDQWGGGDFNYGYGTDYGSLYSSAPELSFGNYSGDIGLDDFTYGYGAGESIDYSDWDVYDYIEAGGTLVPEGPDISFEYGGE